MPEPGAVTLLAMNALGTRVELLLDGTETPGLRAAGEAALNEVRLWHDRLSLFLPRSLLSHVNREAALRAVRLDDDLWRLFSLCTDVHARSGGAFDPTVAGLMRSAGLHPARNDGDAPVGWSALVELDKRARSVRFTRRGVVLDLGGVAKGFALDRAAEVLRECGVESALMHGGTSSVVAIGGRVRTVAVRTGAGHFATTVRDGALCVSAPRGRSAGDATHIIDPERRAPSVRIDTAVVTAAGPDGCARCDAWATALVVLGARPTAMDEDLSSATHDGARWTMHKMDLRALSEAA